MSAATGSCGGCGVAVHLGPPKVPAVKAHIVVFQVPGLPWPSWETCTCAVGVDHEREVGA